MLIFDEVITGFRVAPGGAQQYFGVTPDLATFGKAIANGFPVSCLAGRGDLMDMLVARVMHGGTYNAQPASMAAVIATLIELGKEETFDALNARGNRLLEGIACVLTEADIQARGCGFSADFSCGVLVLMPRLSIIGVRFVQIASGISNLQRHFITKACVRWSEARGFYRQRIQMM